MSKIIGVTVGTTTPRPDWNQSNPNKSDYIKNKPSNLGGGLTDEQLSQFNELIQWHSDATYEEMTVSISPDNLVYEIGSKQMIVFTWTFSKNVGYVTFNGKPLAAEKEGFETLREISSGHSYTVSGTRSDGKQETKSATASVNFYNKYYFGCASNPDVIDSAFIKGLTLHSDWASSRPTFTNTPDVEAGKYIWYAHPKHLGASNFKMGGFPGGFGEAQTVSFTNDSGYTEDYYLYRSIEAGLGNMEIQVL